MVSVPPEWQGALIYISNIFQVRPEWLVFPNVITIFAIPLVLNFFMFYIILNRILRIFQSTGANAIIAGIISFLMLPYNNILAFISPLIIGVWGVENVAYKIILVISLYALYFLIIPWLTTALLTGSFRF